MSVVGRATATWGNVVYTREILDVTPTDGSAEFRSFASGKTTATVALPKFVDNVVIEFKESN